MDSTNLVKGKHLDMVNLLRILIQTSEFKTDGIRIKGHLDKNVPIWFLSWWEQRNVEMDGLAKTYMQALRTTYTVTHSLTQSPYEI